jgi:hypothetical protein
VTGVDLSATEGREERETFERKRMNERPMKKKPLEMSQKKIAITEVYEAF